MEITLDAANVLGQVRRTDPRWIIKKTLSTCNLWLLMVAPTDMICAICERVVELADCLGNI
jgi:hypothetical protein